jgi:glycosyltransferase involved in cell wall biosynthesis
MIPTHRVHVEVTNTLSTHFTSGFQRHTRALLAHLPIDEPDERGLLVTPVVWCPACAAHRLLDADERRRLAHPPRPSAPARARLDVLAERLPIGGRALVRAGGHPVVHWVREQLAKGRQTRAHDPARHPALLTMRSGDVFFEVEAGWHDPEPRDRLLPKLHSQGVRTGLLVADVMPEQHPEWFSPATVERFGRFLRAHLRWSDHVASISSQTTADLAAVAGMLGRDRALQVVQITMGADFGHVRRGVDANRDRRTLLSVGSLEPRKNHTLLLDLFDRLRDSRPEVELLLVGRETDLSKPLVDRIRSHPDHGHRLRWAQHLDDDALEGAYAEAFLALTPSRYEGFGIPVVEALSRGLPTIAATGGALCEAGGDTAEYAEADDLEAWVALVERHLDDEAHHATLRARAASFRPPTWGDAAARLADALVEMSAGSMP